MTRTCGEITGTSEGAVRMRAFADRMGGILQPCRIAGEGGTGKSHLAKIIHARSPFARRLPVSIDFRLLGARESRTALFGGDPPELTTTRRGALERETTVILKRANLAEGFLQEKLAAAMRGGRVVRFGSHVERPVRARLIFLFDETGGRYTGAALVPALRAIIRSIPGCAIPPLRRRLEDLPALAAAILGEPPGRRQLGDLGSQRWEGNIRELAAFLSRTRGQRGDGALAADAALLAWRLREGESFSLEEVLDRMRRHASEEALASCHGNRSLAAGRLGVSTRTLGRVLQ